jgi:uncharacterized membrane protein
VDRVELKHIKVRARNPLARWQQAAHGSLFVFFALDLLLVCLRLRWPGLLFGDARWPDGLLLVLALAATVASLSGQIPAQNAVLAAILIGFMGGAVGLLGATTGVPFGPLVYNKGNVGAFLINPLPWTVPMFWVVTLLNARGVARLVLRKYRFHRNYGFAIMGTTVVLVVLLELSFEPYAVLVKEYWSWKATKLPFTWYSAPLSNFLGWAVTSLLMLLFVTPALINKSPVKKPPAYHPLGVWELLSLPFLLGTTLHGLWTAAVLIVCQMVVVLMLAMVGAGGTRN